MGVLDRFGNTGLIDDFNMKVIKSYWAVDPRFGENLNLTWEGTTDADGRPETTEFYSIGKGWQTHDGNIAVHESGKADAKINNSTKFFRLVQKAVELGIDGIFEDGAKLLDARVWEGYTFHMKRVPVNYGTGIEAREILLPEKVVATPGTSGTVSVAAQAQATGVASADVEAQLTTLAQAAASEQGFKDAAITIPGVAGNNALLAAIVDGSFYARVKAGA